MPPANQLLLRVSRSYSIALADAFQATLITATDEVGRTLRDIARVISSGVAPSELARANRTIAELGQDSVLRSYDQVVTAREGAMRGYDYRRSAKNPKNARDAGGKLREALGSPQLWHADDKGIFFVDVDFLDSRARHWARLNAGAAGIGRGSRQTFQVVWDNLTLMAIGIHMDPSPGFLIPAGYWRAPGGGIVAPGAPGTAAFFPLGEGPFPAGKHDMRVDRENFGSSRGTPLQRKRVSRGIRARNFLDAGVARIAREIGPTYQRMTDDLYKRKIIAAHPGRVTVRAVPNRVRR